MSRSPLMITALCMLILGLFVNPAGAVTYAYIPSYDDDTVVRVQTSNAATISLDISPALPSGDTCSPYGAAVMPDGSAVLVTCETDETVLRITNGDFTAGTYSRSPLAVGEMPRGVAIAPTGDYAYVANYDDNSVSKINLTTFQVVGTPTNVGEGPWGVAVIYDESADVIRVYVANSIEGSVTVINDAVGDSITIEEITGVGGGPTGIAASPDGRYVYVANRTSANVAIIQTSDNTVIDRIGVSGEPWGMAVGSLGNYLYVSNNFNNVVTVIDTGTRAIHDSYLVGAPQLGLAATRNGDFAYVINEDAGDNIRKIDLVADAVEDVIDGQTSGAVSLGNFIGGTPPAGPSGLSGSAPSYDKIDLTWNDNSSDELGFKLERRVAGESAYSQIAELAADTTSYTDSRVVGESAYDYRIRSYNEAADSNYTETSTEITTPEGSFSWCFIGTLLQDRF